MSDSSNGMPESEFDAFADQYATLHESVLGASGESADFFAAYKVVDTAREVRRSDLRPGNLLDFGCGVGNAVPHFRENLPDWKITGADVSAGSLAVATDRFGSIADFIQCEAIRLPVESCSFSVVFTSCVLHHVVPEHRPALIRELLRVLRPGGLLMIFEHNPRNWLTVRAVNDCPLDKNAVLLRSEECLSLCSGAGFGQTKCCYRIFLPGILRWFRPLERAITWLPFGAQYYVRAEKPAATN